MKKTTKKPATPKKRARGRPRKNGGGRVHASTWLPAELLRQLDRHVAGLQKAVPGASRGDVIAEALRKYLKSAARAID